MGTLDGDGQLRRGRQLLIAIFSHALLILRCSFPGLFDGPATRAARLVEVLQELSRCQPALVRGRFGIEVRTLLHTLTHALVNLDSCILRSYLGSTPLGRSLANIVYISELVAGRNLVIVRHVCLRRLTGKLEPFILILSLGFFAYLAHHTLIKSLLIDCDGASYAIVEVAISLLHEMHDCIVHSYRRAL